MNSRRLIGLLCLALCIPLFSCQRVDVSKDVRKVLVGHGWMATHLRDDQGNVVANEVYSLTGYYEQGFRLRPNGKYIARYANGGGERHAGTWYLDAEETVLFVDNGDGIEYSFDMVRLHSDTLELAHSGLQLIFTRE